ncbi:Galactosyltransferase family protein [Heracleum sosnowskyi]|uniref:Galactosyltransferase family protein n=1 Tax=Heracleum sosnowskyi TaxID=360622 RepID=A0AAD8H8X1_9APIA|nr:Galactosyltransferase family protein [Heracleum sosnowskyi]
MASDETNIPELSLLEQLINSRTRPVSQFSPITLPLTNPQNNTNPDQDSLERSDPHDRIILLNPLTQSVVMIEGSAWRINALLNDLVSSNKDGPPPASKASIEAMQTVETKEGDECVICMEEYIDTVAKEMPYIKCLWMRMKIIIRVFLVMRVGEEERFGLVLIVNFEEQPAQHVYRVVE